jgi:hypothetical protein
MVFMVRKIYKRDFQREFNYIICFKDEEDMIFPN